MMLHYFTLHASYYSSLHSLIFPPLHSLFILLLTTSFIVHPITHYFISFILPYYSLLHFILHPLLLITHFVHPVTHFVISFILLVISFILLYLFILLYSFIPVTHYSFPLHMSGDCRVLFLLKPVRDVVKPACPAVCSSRSNASCSVACNCPGEQNGHHTAETDTCACVRPCVFCCAGPNGPVW